MRISKYPLLITVLLQAFFLLPSSDAAIPEIFAIFPNGHIVSADPIGSSNIRNLHTYTQLGNVNNLSLTSPSASPAPSATSQVFKTASRFAKGGAYVVIVAGVAIVVVEVSMIADGINDINNAYNESDRLNNQLSELTGVSQSHYQNTDRQAEDSAYRACTEGGTFSGYCWFGYQAPRLFDWF